MPEPKNQNSSSKKQKKPSWIFKIAVLGDPAVGKTSLIDNYVQKKFESNYNPTLGVNIVIKEIYLEKHKIDVRLLLWDIAGQSKYDLSRKIFFQGCQGAIFTYDITRASTFKAIKEKWLKDFKEYSNEGSSYMLVGNKNDLEDLRQITPEQGNALSNNIGSNLFVETSAKYGDNVEKAFLSLVDHLLRKAFTEA